MRLRLRLLGFLVVFSMLLTGFAAIDAAPAEAQTSSFDQQLISLANSHRASLGLAPLTASPSISAGALAWSQHMLGGHANYPANFRHASGLGNLGENIGYAHGPVGQPVGISWPTGAGPLPSYCTSSMDYTSAPFMMCNWLSSSGHRSAIENPNYRQIGSGTATGPGQFGRLTYSTHRFSSAAPAPVDVAISSPGNGAKLACGSQTLSWTGPATGTYVVHVGSYNGAADYMSKSAGSNRSISMTGLPSDGSTVYVRLWHLAVGGAWELEESRTFVACGTAVAPAISSPANGAKLACGNQTLSWVGPGSGTYAVWAGSYDGGADYVFASAGSNRSIVMAGLPSDGSNVYVRLFHLAVGGSWQQVDAATFEACGTAVPPAITSPAAGLRLCGNPTLTWDGPESGTYAVWAGSYDGAANYVFASAGSNRSLVMTGLPDSGPVYVRLYHVAVGGIWKHVDSAQFFGCDP